MKRINNIIIAIGIVGWFTSCGSEKVEGTTSNDVVNVEVKSVGLTESNVRFQYSGKVISDDQTVLSTKILGQVKNVNVSEGDKVSKGDLLVQIKSKDIDSKLASAKASLREAKSAHTNTKKNYDRISNLFEKGSATQREFDDISTALDGTNARVESIQQSISELEELLTYVNLRSPIDGFVSQKYVNTGDMATPGSPILALESLDQLKMEINVPEFEIQMFEERDPVTIRFNALAEKVYQGVVDKVIPSTAFSGSQFKVSVVITDVDKSIKPGMYGKVNMLKNAAHKLIIPESVIIERGQLKGIYTVNQQGEAMLRWLRLGKKSALGYEVLSGLDEGDLLIVSSESKLIDGQSVKITKTL